MNMQQVMLGLSVLLLFIGIIIYDLVVSILGLVGIALSGWGYVYPERANVLLYRVQSNFAKERIDKEYKEYEKEIKLAEGYLTRFAETFNLKFPLEWSVNHEGEIVPATINELSQDQLKQPFHHFQELLQDEGIVIPEYILQLAINKKVDELRYRSFAEIINNHVDKQKTPQNIIKLYCKQIGSTTEEIQSMKKTFMTDYLLQYLISNFSKEDIKVQLRLDLSEMSKAKEDIQIALQTYAKDLERERRVNTMRGILYGKIKPSIHKDLKSWTDQGNKAMEDDLRELFLRMGYEVKEPSTRLQGTDFLLKKAGQRIAVRFILLLEGTVTARTIQEAYAGKSYWECQSCIVVSNVSFSEDATEMANKLHVETWDGILVQKMLDKYWNQDIEYWNLLQQNDLSTVKDEKEQEATQSIHSFSHIN